jgi:hypothetical protein
MSLARFAFQACSFNKGIGSKDRWSVGEPFAGPICVRFKSAIRFMRLKQLRRDRWSYFVPPYFSSQARRIRRSMAG